MLVIGSLGVLLVVGIAGIYSFVANREHQPRQQVKTGDGYTGKVSTTEVGDHAAEVGPQRGVLVDDFIGGRPVELADVLVSAEPKVSELEPDNPEQQPQPGNKLVMLHLDITTRRADAVFDTSIFGLLGDDGEVYHAWGVYDDFLGRKVLLKTQIKTKTNLADITVSKGLVFEIPETLELQSMRFVWDLEPTEYADASATD